MAVKGCAQNDWEYLILCDGRVVAKFKFEGDRDACFDCLRERHPDHEFTKAITS